MTTEQPTELIERLAGMLDLSGVPQTIRARAAQERVLLDATQQQSETPQTVWRYAWLQHREALLMPTMLGDEVVHVLCLEHARAMRAAAAGAHAHAAPRTPARGMLRPIAAASLGLWSALAARMDETQPVACAWSGRDGEEFLWLNFCMLALLVWHESDGRARNRRTLADLLAQIQKPERSASTIRLKLLPEAEHYFESADQWAALLAGSRS